MSEKNGTNDAICCPVFNPGPWDKATHEWKEKPFLVSTVSTFLHMPLPGSYGQAITRSWELAKFEGVAPAPDNCILLTNDTSPWKSELYLSITADKRGLPVKKLSGTFASMTFDGSYSGVPSYIKKMNAWLAETGKKAKRFFFYYTTCPKCAKKYGHNWIVCFAEL